jgi:hypothetical protein
VADAPNDLAKRIDALVEEFGPDSVLAHLPRKKRGRPRGSGIDDRAALYRMAKFIYSGAVSSVTQAAFRCLELTEVHSRASASRRLRGKFQRERSSWLSVVEAVTKLERLVGQVGQRLEDLAASAPLEVEDKEEVKLMLSVRNTVRETARETAARGPEEAAEDFQRVADLLEEKWRDFFSKRPFVRREIQADKSPSTQ